MAYELNPQMADEFRANLERLIDTCWLFVFGIVDINYVQIVDVSPGRAYNRAASPSLTNWPQAQAHLVTLYGTRFQHWWVPVTDILAEYGAFEWLGTATELAWIRPHNWIVNVSDLHAGAWYIDHVDANYVPLRLPQNDDVYPGPNVPISTIVSEWREAGPLEISSALDREAETQQAESGAGPAPPSSEPTRSAWDRINDDESE